MILASDSTINGGVLHATDEELDELKQILPYHVYITRESALSDAYKLAKWCTSLKHRWNFIQSSNERFLFMFVRSQDAVKFELRFV